MTEQEEILCILQEECAEVSQVVCKIRRFGIDEINYHSNKSQQETLEDEIGDLLCLIDIAIERKMLNLDRLHQAKANKREKLKTWSNIQFTLNPED
jgi:NTP pyrophosphatase (non-canonical NTP hydrolase)